MYVICWMKNGKREWDLISGEDAMQEFVSDLCKKLNLESEDIFVFNNESEL